VTSLASSSRRRLASMRPIPLVLCINAVRTVLRGDHTKLNGLKQHFCGREYFRRRSSLAEVVAKETGENVALNNRPPAQRETSGRAPGKALSRHAHFPPKGLSKPQSPLAALIEGERARSRRSVYVRLAIVVVVVARD